MSTRHMDQAQRNSDDFSFGMALNEHMHGATDADLERRKYSKETRQRVFAHMDALREQAWRQAPEVTG